MEIWPRRADSCMVVAVGKITLPYDDVYGCVSRLFSLLGTKYQVDAVVEEEEGGVCSD